MCVNGHKVNEAKYPAGKVTKEDLKESPTPTPSHKLPRGRAKPRVTPGGDKFTTGWNDSWMKVRLPNENEWRMGLDFKTT